MDQEKIKHLEFIQNIINRMNSNSFQIKEWMVTILAAFLAIFATTKKDLIILIAVSPVLIFWFLDAYYLMEERKFRGLYDDVAGISRNPKTIRPFEMTLDLYIGDKFSYWKVFWSIRIWRLYLPIILILIVAYSIFRYVQ